ncbi:TIGR03086 family metal-binding protein [Mycobacterium sp. CPCC 205372]|uniref:TIGR03086 family metal-binding protein n=1 Tax=Mycobacterium hippophais TaxID=3016340 RepID=A0ABT4PYE9_9MYCO|nr:TIGR03086 family metal-binding protein [Mycobacterium hippophais]MCZ8381474.1 TIGR03086 family metal-binding protein [Mycobacterium hippophais]
MLTDTDLRPLHRRAVLASVDAVTAVTPEHLDLPTPCGDWTLRRLLAHMTVQHHGFAASARGGATELQVWDPDRVTAAVTADPVGSYTAAAEDLLTAFSADGVPEASFALPEFGPDAVFPGSVAIAMHFVDYAVHGWDVARSLGRPFALDDDVAAAALSVARIVPDDETRAAAGAPFGRAVQAGDGATDLDLLVAHLGRSPHWPA